jgi:hypothetical protein
MDGCCYRRVPESAHLETDRADVGCDFYAEGQFGTDKQPYRAKTAYTAAHPV